MVDNGNDGVMSVAIINSRWWAVLGENNHGTSGGGERTMKGHFGHFYMKFEDIPN